MASSGSNKASAKGKKHKKLLPPISQKEKVVQKDGVKTDSLTKPKEASNVKIKVNGVANLWGNFKSASKPVAVAISGFVSGGVTKSKKFVSDKFPNQFAYISKTSKNLGDRMSQQRNLIVQRYQAMPLRVKYIVNFLFLFLILSSFVALYYANNEYKYRPYVTSATVLDGETDVPLDQKIVITMSGYVLPKKLEKKIQESGLDGFAVKYMGNNQYELSPKTALEPDLFYMLTLDNDSLVRSPYTLSFRTVNSPSIQATNFATEMVKGSSVLIAFNQPVFEGNFNNESADAKSEIQNPISFNPAVDFTTEYLSPSLVRLTAKDGLDMGTYTISINPDAITNQFGVKMQGKFQYQFDVVEALSEDVESVGKGDILISQLLDAKVDTSIPIYLFLSSEVNPDKIADSINLYSVDGEEKKADEKVDVVYTITSVDEYISKYTDKFNSYSGSKFYLVKITPSAKWQLGKTYGVNIKEGFSLITGEKLNTDIDLDIVVDDVLAIEISSMDSELMRVEFNHSISSSKAEVSRLITVTDSKGKTVALKKIEPSDDSIYLYPTKPFVEGQTYTVKIGKGIKDRYGTATTTILSHSMTFEEAPVSSQVSIEGPKIAVVEKSAEIKMLVETRNVSGVKTEIMKVDNVSDAYQIINASSTADAIKYIDSLDSVIETRNRDFKAKELNRYVEILKDYKEGIYVVRMSYGSNVEYKVYAITSNVVMMKQTSSETLVWIVSSKDGRPYANKTVKGLAGQQEVSATTDGEGVARFDRKLDAVYSNDLSIFSTYEFTSSIANYESDSNDVDSNVGFIYSDRALYKPGEEVNFKVYAKVLDGNSYVPAQGEYVVELSSYDSDDEVTTKVTLNEFGTASGTVRIPQDASPSSDYRLHLFRKSGNIYIDSFELQIQNYRLNNIEVNAEVTQKEIFKSKDTVNLSVNANYYFGQPVSGQEVVVDLYVRDNSEYMYEVEEKYPDFRFYTYYYYDDIYSAFSSQKIGTVRGKLDKSGRLELPISYEIPEKFAYGNGKTLSLDISVGDGLGDKVSVTKYLSVAPRGGTLGADLDEKGNVSVISVGEGYDVAPYSRVKVEVFNEKWTAVLVKEVNGVTYWKNEYVPTLVKSQIVTTDRNGKAVFNAGVVNREEYSYKVKLTSVANPNLTRQMYLYDSWDYFDGYYTPYSEDREVIISLDKKEYKVGETVKFAPQVESGKYRFFTAIEKNGIVEYKIYDKKQLSDMKFQVSDNYLPNFNISVFAVKTHDSGDRFLDFRFGSVNVPISKSEYTLKLTATPSKDIYLPGEQVDVKIASNKAVETEYLVAVVDQAVLDLQTVTSNQNVEADMFEELWNDIGTGVDNYTNLTAYEDQLIAQTTWALKGGAGGDGSFIDSLQEEDIRSIFKASATWLPAKVSPDGKLDISFELPDNLTTWNVLVIGYTKDGQIGTSVSKILSSKDVNILSNSPSAVYLSDKPELMYTASFSNAFKKLVGNSKLTVEFASKAGKILCGDKYESSCVRNLGVDELPTYYLYQPAQVGMDEITFGIKYGDKVYDVVRNDLEVKSDVKEFTKVSYGNTFTNDTLAYKFPGSSKAQTIKLSVTNGLDINTEDYLEVAENRNYSLTSEFSAQLFMLLTYKDQIADSDELINDIISKLEQKQGSDGYWCNYLSYCSNSYWEYNVTFDAYEALALARAEGYKVNDSVLSRAKETILNLNNADLRDSDTLRARRYYVMAMAGDFNISEVAFFYKSNRFDISNQAKGYTLMALNKIYETEGISKTDKALVSDTLVEIRQDLLLSARRTTDFVYWRESYDNRGFYYRSFENEIHANSVIARAMMAGGAQDNSVIGVAKYLENSFSQYDLDMEEVSCILRALHSIETTYEVAGGKIETKDFSAYLNGSQITNFESVDGKLVATLETPADQKELFIKLQSKGLISFKAEYQYDVDIADIKASDSGLSLATELTDMSGKQVDVFDLGKTYKLKTYMVVPGDLQETTLTLNIPAGFEPVNFNLAGESEGLSYKLNEENSDAGYMGISFIKDEIWPGAVKLYTGNSLYGTRIQKGIYTHTIYVRAERKGTYLSTGSEFSEKYYPARSSQQSSYTIVVR